MINKLLKHFRRNFLLYFLVLIALLLRLTNLSVWLEDWDSVQFVMALNHYSIVEHLPHPPGYPLYILLGKLFNVFFQNEAKSLEAMSAIFGAFSVIPLFLLARKMFKEQVAIIASLLFIVTPVHWLLSKVALTNVPGQFFLLLLIYFLYCYRQSHKGILVISLLFGLILGIRFTEIPIIVALMALVLFQKRDLKLAVYAFLAFIGGILIWVLPLIYITGFKEFLNSYIIIASYIFKHDSLGFSLGLFGSIKKRLFDYWVLLNISYSIYLLLTFFVGITSYTFLKKKLAFNFEVIFLLTYLFSYVLVHLSVFNMEVTRYTLPILPPLVILTSLFIVKLLSNKPLRYIFIFTLTGVITFNSLDQLNRFHKTIPATISPVLYVNKNFEPNQTLIISTVTFRHFQYYAPNYQLYNTDGSLHIDLLDKEIIIIDYLGILDKYPLLKNYELINHVQFNVDRDIFPRVYETNLYILKRRHE